MTKKRLSIQKIKKLTKYTTQALILEKRHFVIRFMCNNIL